MSNGMQGLALALDGHVSAPLSIRSTPVSVEQKSGEEGRFKWVDKASMEKAVGKVEIAMPGQFPGAEMSLLD